MPLTKFKRGKTWYLRGTVRGRDVYESTGTHDARAAETIRIQREAAILEESILGRRRVATFVEAALIYLEQGGDARFVGRYDETSGRWSGLIGYFGQTRLNEIGQIELDRAAVTLHPTASPETRNRQVYTPFIAIWNKAARRELCERREWERPKQRAEPRSRWCRPHEVALLLKHAAPHLHPLVMFLALTGARMSEALYLNWNSVDLAQGWVTLRNGKRHGELRDIPLRPELAACLERLPVKTGAVFRTQRGEPYADNEKQWGGQTKTAWRGMCRRAEILDVTPHTLRHTFSTWLTQAGVSERVRDELMGHASQTLGTRYAHVASEVLRHAIDQLPALELADDQPTQRVARRRRNTRAPN